MSEEIPTRLIMDDPHMHRTSEEELEKTLVWWREVCLNNPKLKFGGGSILHDLDLTGYLLKDEKKNFPIQEPFHLDASKTLEIE